VSPVDRPSPAILAPKGIQGVQVVTRFVAEDTPVSFLDDTEPLVPCLLTILLLDCTTFNISSLRYLCCDPLKTMHDGVNAITLTLADYERLLRCIQLCQPLASVVPRGTRSNLNLKRRAVSTCPLLFPPKSTMLASSLNPVWFTCRSPPCSPSSHFLLSHSLIIRLPVV
jgi:hypothetical protein